MGNPHGMGHSEGTVPLSSGMSPFGSSFPITDFNTQAALANVTAILEEESPVKNLKVEVGLKKMNSPRKAMSPGIEGLSPLGSAQSSVSSPDTGSVNQMSNTSKRKNGGRLLQT